MRAAITRWRSALGSPEPLGNSRAKAANGLFSAGCGCRAAFHEMHATVSRFCVMPTPTCSDGIGARPFHFSARY